ESAAARRIPPRSRPHRAEGQGSAKESVTRRFRPLSEGFYLPKTKVPSLLGELLPACPALPAPEPIVANTPGPASLPGSPPRQEHHAVAVPRPPARPTPACSE